MSQELINLMADLMEDETLAMVKELVASGTDPMDILDDARSAPWKWWERGFENG